MGLVVQGTSKMHSSDPGKPLRTFSVTPSEGTLRVDFRWAESDVAGSICLQQMEHFYQYRNIFYSNPSRMADGRGNLFPDLCSVWPHLSTGGMSTHYHLLSMTRKKMSGGATRTETHRCNRGGPGQSTPIPGLSAAITETTVFYVRTYAHHGNSHTRTMSCQATQSLTAKY